MQDRLPVFFKLEGIETVEQANGAFPRFIADFNKKFSVEPTSDDNYFKPLPSDVDLSIASENFTPKALKFTRENEQTVVCYHPMSAFTVFFTLAK
jgi:hypothetical protein